MEQLFWALGTVAIGVAGCAAYFYLSNLILDTILPGRGPDAAKAGRNINRANLIRPWLFLAPALLALTIYLVYPVIESVWLSLHDRSGQNFVGLSNYVWMVNDPGFRESGP